MAVDNPNWGNLYFVSPSVGSPQRIAIGIRGFAVGTVRREADQFQRLQLCLHPLIFPFSSLSGTLGLQLARKYLKVERLMGQPWEDIHWPKFQHLGKIFLLSVIVARPVVFTCRLKTSAAYLVSKDLIGPCSCKCDWLDCSAALFIFIHSCLVESCFFCFCESFLFCLCDCRTSEKKTKNQQKKKQQPQTQTKPTTEMSSMAREDECD